MMTAPPKFKTQFPIVQNRYEDFVALHVNISLAGATTTRSRESSKQSLMLQIGQKVPEEIVLPGAPGFGNQPPPFFHGAHESGNILPWHRYTIQMWEDTLISECGWEGGVPCM
jgi:tyrosinase